MSASNKIPNSPIAVVGVGCRFPEAPDTDAFWSLIDRGQVTFREVPPERWNHEIFYSPNQRDVDRAWVASGSFIEEFREFAALHYGIAPRRLEVMDPQQRLLIESTRWALQDAGYERTGFDRRRTGVFFGVSVSEFKNIAQSRVHAMQLAGGDFGPPAGTDELRRAMMQMVSNVAPMRAFHLSGSLTALAAATVAQTFDLGGPAYVIDSACASASVAVNDAMLHLRAGLLDHAVAGGAYLNLSPDNLVAFTKIGAISPDGVCRPFDHRSNGFVQSDGVGVLVLKRLDDAVRDGDRVHAVLLGSGCNNDGRGEGPMTPRFEGQIEVLRAAYADADVSPSSVSYFEAHGTATSIGDPVEIRALGTLLSESGRQLGDPALVGSVKGNIGHAMSAAGIAGLIKAIKVVEEGVAPPQPGFEKPNPKLELERLPLQVCTERRRIDPPSGHPLRVAVSSFGFGGTNSHLVLEAPPRADRRPELSRSIEISMSSSDDAPAIEPEVLLITAPTAKLLAEQLERLETYLSEGPGRRVSIADLAFTLNARRTRERFRAVVGARTAVELFRNLGAARAALEGEPTLPVQVSPHVTIHDAGAAEDRIAPKLAFLFPGQGAQKTGLLAGVRRRFPVFQAALERFEAGLGDLLPKSLSSYLYPEVDDAAAEAELTQTAVCQPAITALTLALAELLDRAGVSAHVSLGHSLGEFTALAHAGALEPSQATRLVARRGAAMRDLALPDPGAMAAVMTDAKTVEAAIAGIDGVVVANYNHPRQVSISGTTAAVEAASERLTEAGHDVRRLAVSHAFHSPVLGDVDRQIEGLLSDIEFSAPKHVVASCVAGEVHTADADRTRAVLARHATSPVDFVRGLNQARDAGADVFVQVGAGAVLVSFARATFGKDVRTLTLAPTLDDGGYEFLRGLATLAALGVDVDFEAVYGAGERRVVTLPETPLERQSYWVVKSQPQPTPELTHPLPGPDDPAVRLGAGGQAAAAEATADLSPARLAELGSVAADRSGLVALFEKQAELLRAHAEIIAGQNRALLGAGGEPAFAPAAGTGTAAVPHRAAAEVPERSATTSTPAPPVPAPATPEPAPAASEVDSDSVRDQVLQIISKVSAFPQDSLRIEQRLVDELGFDSLMVADLGGAIESAFPSAGGLPPTLFGLETTVGDITAHLVSALGSGPSDAAPQTPDAVKASATRYRVVPRPQPRARGTSHDVAGETWLVTEDDSRLSAELSSSLAARGARLIRVRFSKQGVAAPARVAFGSVNLWPEAFVDGLPGALSDAGIQLDGFVHAASLAPPTDGEEPRHPITLLHPLAAKLDVARMVVVTSLGGKLGLERSPTLSRNVLQSAALGYTKALARERPQRTIRAIDVDPRVEPARNAGWVIDELLSGDLAPEVGFTGGQRVVPELEPTEPGTTTRRVGAQDVVLITGGTGEIGSQVADWVADQQPKGIILAGRREADPAIDEQLARLRARGTTAAYVSVDVTVPDALASATRLLAERVGEVTVVFHAAGVIEDAPAENKSAESVERVIATKIAPVQAVLQSFPKLKDLVLFSSWAGRFGNAGQVDYSAANELLDRIAVASGTGATRTVSIAWPPWDGTRMVASIPAPIRAAMEKQGVTFLEASEGIELLRAIFEEDRRGVEVIGRELPARELKARWTETFSLDRHPYLDDHRLNGRPVVPLASIADWVGEAFLGAAGVEGSYTIENLTLTRGVFGDERAELRLDGRVRADGAVEAMVEVRAGEDLTLAYRARVHSDPKTTHLAPIELTGSPKTAPLTLDAFYRDHTFHGPMLRGIKRLNRSTSEGMSGLVRASDVKAWQPKSERAAWALDPLVVDGSFQLAGYWLHVHHGKAGFPIGFDRLTVLHPFGQEPVHCVVRLREVTEDGFAGDLWYEDADGRPHALLQNIRGRFAELEASPEVEPRSAPAAAVEPPLPTAAASVPAAAPAPAAAPSINGAPTPVIAEVAPAVEVDDATWDVGKFPEVEALQQRFQMAELMGLTNPYFSLHAGTARDTSVVNGKEMIHFSGYNYLGFSGRPEVNEAAKRAADKYGTSVSASRVASGERPIHREFEQGIAEHLGVEDAILYVGGHATNVTTVGHIIDKDDLVVHDSLIHDSIFQGVKLSGAKRRPFPHNDMKALERILAQTRSSFRRVLIAAEGIYSMDGDICDLPRLIELKKKYRCLLLVDEAHSIGVLGHQGRGVGHHFEGIDPNDVDMWMGTLSKSFASVGGYIAGRKALIEYLKYTAPGFVYSVGLAPPNTGAALEALRLMQAEPETVERLRANSMFFLQTCKSLGLDTGPAVGAAVIPIIVGDSMLCLKLSAGLAERGINVQPIVYPAVENESARLRFFISSLHSEQQLRYAAETTKKTLEELRSKDADGDQARV